MTYILGINAFHGDSSACLVKDGALVAAVEEERFRRVKHWAGFPTEAIRYCLSAEELGRDFSATIWTELNYRVELGGV